jgi:hypothetical protein
VTLERSLGESETRIITKLIAKQFDEWMTMESFTELVESEQEYQHRHGQQQIGQLNSSDHLEAGPGDTIGNSETLRNTKI